MKKILLSLVAVFVCANAWAETTTIATFSFTKSGSAIPTGWTGTGTNCTSTGNYFYLTSDGSLVSPEIDFSLYSSIEVNMTVGRYGSLSGFKATVQFTANDVVLGSLDGTSSTPSDVSATNITAVTSGTYPIVFKCTNATTTSHGARITAITIKGSLSNGKEEPTWSISPTTLSLEVNETQDVAVTTNYDGTLTVTSENPDVASVSYNSSTKMISVTGEGAGSTKISISGPETNSYNSLSKSFDVTVTPALLSYNRVHTQSWGYAFFELSDAIGSSTYAQPDETSRVKELNGLTVTLSKGTSGTNVRYDEKYVRIYNGNTLEISVPEGNSISSVVFIEPSSNKSWGGKISTEVGTYSETEKTWIASTVVNSVTFNIGATNRVGGILVKVNETTNYRTVTSGNFGTICLPYAVAAEARTGATYYNIAGVVKSGEVVTGVALEEETGALVAGKPYVFKATATTLSATYSGEAVTEAVEATGLVGTLAEEGITLTSEGKYILSNNKLCKLAGGTATIAQNRAYFDLDGVSEYSGAPESHVVFIEVETDGNANGLDAVAASQRQEIYDLTGRRVSVATKGMFIINGKKVVINR